MQLARAQGDFLLVGLHTDDDIMERRGAHLPIMDLHERALSVLACCYVNEVIIGQCLLAPREYFQGASQAGWQPPITSGLLPAALQSVMQPVLVLVVALPPLQSFPVQEGA